MSIDENFLFGGVKQQQQRNDKSFNSLWEQAEALAGIEKTLFVNQFYDPNTKQIRTWTSINNPRYRKRLLDERGRTCEVCRTKPNGIFHPVNGNKEDARPINIFIVCRQCSTDLISQKMCLISKERSKI